jgi:hypothetical protein
MLQLVNTAAVAKRKRLVLMQMILQSPGQRNLQKEKPSLSEWLTNFINYLFKQLLRSCASSALIFHFHPG